jgi:hypothetical protein
MDPRAAIALTAVVMDLTDLGQERGIGARTCAHRALAPCVITGRGNLEHGAHQPYRISNAMVLDEAEAHVRVPAKIAIDFLRNSRIGVARNGLQHEA